MEAENGTESGHCRPGPADCVVVRFGPTAGVTEAAVQSKENAIPMKLDSETRVICDFMHYAFRPSLSKAERVAEMYRDILTDPEVEIFDWRDFPSARALSAKILRQKLEAAGISKIKIGVTAGMDSRGLLGAILDVLPAENIIAFTTGQEGNKDFERARYFTEGLLPHHYLIGTADGTYSAEEWVKLFQARPPNVTGSLYGKSLQTNDPMAEHGWLPKLTGFLGDATSGKRLHGLVHENWDEALAAFVHKNEVFRPSSKRVIASMLPPEYDPFHVLPDRPLLPRALMSFDDQLDMSYRQYQRVGLGFLPDDKTFNRSSKGQTKRNMHQITVYDDPRWQKSYFTMPIEERIGQKHYKAMLKANFPHIFLDLVNPDDPRFAPEKAAETAKERLVQSAKTGLHTNWEALWMDNENFHSFATELITSLGRRDVLPWLSPIDLLDHLEKDILGLGKILWCLCSVELNLRAGKLPLPDHAKTP